MAGDPNKKDLWDKASVFLHPMGGLLTALAVTVVGTRGSRCWTAAIRGHQRAALFRADEPRARKRNPA
jgi:hypothetical protein